MDKIDVDSINNKVKDIIEYVNRDENKKARELNYNMFEMKVQKEYSDFYNEYPTLLKMIVKGNNLDMLNKMLNMITRINNKEIDKFEGEKELGESLAEQYLYPVVKDKKPLTKKELEERQRMN